MTKLYMFVGLPGSGKSTIADDHYQRMVEKGEHPVYLSTDAHIERYAERVGKTYNEVFGKYISTAQSIMQNDLERAIKNNRPIVWDQTNLTVKSRASKLAKIPSFYTKIAINVNCPDHVHARRLATRPGKNIPVDVIAKMKADLQWASLPEFHRVIHVISDDNGWSYLDG